MWGSTRTTGFCFTPHIRGASAEARRKPSLKESSKGTSSAEDKKQGSFQDDPYLNRSQLYGFPLFNSSFDSWSTSLVQFRAPKSPLSSSPVEHLQNSSNSFQFFTPSIPLNWFSRHTRVLHGKLLKTCHTAFLPPNPVLLLSPTFTLWLQDPN